jgi:hypothetical protein
MNHSLQEALPVFKSLAEITKYMEGESYVLSSTAWWALGKIETILSPKVADSAEMAAMRLAMYNDHMNKRVTLSQSLQTPLHVLMHLLDHRSVSSWRRAFSFEHFYLAPFPVQVENKSSWRFN